jgi:hypothetical protein
VTDRVAQKAGHVVVPRKDGRASRPLPVVVPTRLYQAYILDLDGTIYLGHDLLPGARRLVEELRARNKPVRFLSNNPTRDPGLPAGLVWRTSGCPRGRGPGSVAARRSERPPREDDWQAASGSSSQRC